MNIKEKLLAIGRDFSERVYSSPVTVDGPLYRVGASFRSHLQLASDDGLVTNPPMDIFTKLKWYETGETMIVSYGAAFDKGQQNGDFLHRRDGARLSFTVQLDMVGNSDKLLTAVSYRFHLRFLPGSVPEYLRFDLGRPHSNPIAEPRFHAHVGTKGLRIPTPALSPLEALAFALHCDESET